MSLKWTGSESGILRKSELKEKKEELFVFGYSCKLFREDERALLIDQGKHLIPWMGDETLKIDRYDARGALHDLSALEAPPGGFDWRVELTRAERDVEQLCDEERYRALHTNEDEEEMYKEEELKRLHAAGYGQVGFNYDAPAPPAQAAPPAEVDEPFLPTASFRAMLPVDIVLPETEKQNAIIEKTAKFIASQGAQMEILIKAKQRDNPQFQFLNRDSVLHLYYTALTALVKADRWPEKVPEIVEERHVENEDYLHPSLASTIIESAPSIPSIHYKPSADCDYTMLISKMRGSGDASPEPDTPLAPGELPPPGTEPPPPRTADICRAPVLYRNAQDTHTTPPPQTPQAVPAHYQQYAAYYHQYMAQTAALQAMQIQQPAQVDPSQPAPPNSTGLSLMKNYDSASDSDVSDADDSSSTENKADPPQQLPAPPADVLTVIDKMAAYVARNGTKFAEIVRAKRDPRFGFLDPGHQHHAHYARLLEQKRGLAVNGADGAAANKAPVSFSIKKLKEPDPILPKPALPYETSSDEESEHKTENHSEKTEDDKEIPKSNIPQVYTTLHIPQAVVYKMGGTTDNNLPTVKAYEQPNYASKTVSNATNLVAENAAPAVEKEKFEKLIPENTKVLAAPEKKHEVKKSPTPEKRPEKNYNEKNYNEKNYNEDRYRESPRRDTRSHKDKKREYNTKSDGRDRRSAEREKKRDRDGGRVKKRKKHTHDDLESEIISLEDNSDDLIDLTGDQSDSKGDCDGEAERAKQRERRRRAAEFLKKVGVDPSAAVALPTSSLASAMVDTLETLRKKKAEDEEKRKKREKRRHKEKHGYTDDADKSHRKSKRRKHKSSDEDEESDYDSPKKKKRRKDKKSSRNKKKRRREVIEEDEEMDHPLPPDLDLSNTLKELRTSSPTKELVLQDTEDTQQSYRHDSSSDEEVNRRITKKKDSSSDEEVNRRRPNKEEKSEGEWSSDSERDSEESSGNEED